MNVFVFIFSLYGYVYYYSDFKMLRIMKICNMLISCERIFRGNYSLMFDYSQTFIYITFYSYIPPVTRLVTNSLAVSHSFRSHRHPLSPLSHLPK